jgi:hypothetical protein
MSNENEVAQLLSFNNGKDVFHMGLQRNVLGEEMRAIPQSGETWRENPVPASPENIGYTTPAPAPVPRTMHQDEGAALISCLKLDLRLCEFGFRQFFRHVLGL